MDAITLGYEGNYLGQTLKGSYDIFRYGNELWLVNRENALCHKIPQEHEKHYLESLDQPNEV